MQRQQQHIPALFTRNIPWVQLIANTPLGFLKDPPRRFSSILIFLASHSPLHIYFKSNLQHLFLPFLSLSASLCVSLPPSLALLSTPPPPASVNSWTASWLNINNSHQLSLMTHYNPSNGEGGRGRVGHSQVKIERAHTHTYIHRVEVSGISFFPFTNFHL